MTLVDNKLVLLEVGCLWYLNIVKEIRLKTKSKKLCQTNKLKQK